MKSIFLFLAVNITCCLMLTLFLSTAAHASTPPPQILYSDLINGPPTGGQGGTNGAFVTIYGRYFGTSQGSSTVSVGGVNAANYPVWQDGKVSFQLAASTPTGDQKIILTTSEGNSNFLPFYVNTPGQAHIYFATADDCAKETGTGTYSDPFCNLHSFYNQITPGDIVYLRGGVYDNVYGNRQCKSSTICTEKDGTGNQYIAWVGYPGEHAELRSLAVNKPRHLVNLSPSDHLGWADYQIFSQLDLNGNDVASLGGFNTGGVWGENKGASYTRWIDLKIHKAYRKYHQTGSIKIGGRPHHKILGCEMYDLGYSGAANKDHLMYITQGVDDVEFAYNYVHDYAFGTLWQVHLSKTPLLYENIRVHHNTFDASSYAPNRGFSVSVTTADTHVYFYNNIVIGGGNNSGDAYGGAQAAYGYGTLHIWNNTFYNVSADNSQGPNRSIFRVLDASGKPGNYMDLRNNIIYCADQVNNLTYEGSKSIGHLTASNNIWYNCDNTNFGSSPPRQDSNPITASPGLADPGNGNFSITNSGSAYNAGIPTVSSLVTDDYVGSPRPRGGKWDIGAYEF